MELTKKQKTQKIDPVWDIFYKDIKPRVSDVIKRECTFELGEFVIDTFSNSLKGKVMDILMKTLSVKCQMHLGSRTFVDLIKGMSKDEFFMELGEFPELKPNIENYINLQLSSITLFFNRLNKDWTELRATFNITSKIIRKIEINAGDLHNGGMSVFCVKFSRVIIYYKPRSVANEVFYNGFVTNLNEIGLTKLKTTNVLDKNGYGWEEKVNHVYSNDLEKYYSNVGVTLALCYLLGIKDVHSENLICSENCPVVIDKEMLFDSVIAGANINIYKYQSVLSVGILPELIETGYQSTLVDMSAIGDINDEYSFAYMPMATNYLNEKMSISYVKQKTEVNKNIPLEQITYKLIHEHMNHVILGFKSFLKKVSDNKEMIRNFVNQGFTDIFKSRALIRHTDTYTRVLFESYHPLLLQEEGEREKFIRRCMSDSLSDAIIGKNEIVEQEVKSLLQNDIPYFYYISKEKSLYCNGSEILKNFLNHSGVCLFNKRLDKLNESEIKLQARLIELAYFTRSWSADNKEIVTAPNFSEKEKDVDLLINKHRQRIEKIVENHHYEIDQESNWLTPYFESKKIEIMPMNNFIYEGQLGMALYYLSNNQGISAYRVFEYAVNEAVNRMDDFVSVGLINGLGGFFYVASKVKRYITSGCEKKMDIILARCMVCMKNEEVDLEVYEGLSGLLIALIHYTKSVKCVEKEIDIVYNAITNKFIKENDLVSWESDMVLAGLAHGCSGICLALAYHYDLYKKDQTIHDIQGLINFEDSLFDIEVNDWKDLRVGARKDFSAWCNGSMGIGLSRMKVEELTGINMNREKLKIAFENTIKLGFGDNHGLCHGDIGNLFFVKKYCEEVLHDKTSFNQLFIEVLNSMNVEINTENLPSKYPIIGFWLGLAGMHYGIGFLNNEIADNFLIFE